MWQMRLYTEPQMTEDCIGYFHNPSLGKNMTEISVSNCRLLLPDFEEPTVKKHSKNKDLDRPLSISLR